MTEVSIIMGARARPAQTLRTLQSYTKLSYKDYEIIFVDVHCINGTLHDVFSQFKDKLPIRYFHLTENYNEYIPGITTWTPATTWNFGMQKAEGKFIIISGADILLSYPDIIERFLSQYKDRRNAVLTHFLSAGMVNGLAGIDWMNNPDLIQTLPEYWTAVINDITNSTRTTAGHTTYLTGQPRMDWEWMGGFRTDLTHLVNDQDLVVRETAVNKQAGMLEGYICYHQSHPPFEERIKVPGHSGVFSIVKPGWNYQNEAQARLLEPAPNDPQ